MPISLTRKLCWIASMSYHQVRNDSIVFITYLMELIKEGLHNSRKCES